MDQRTPPQKLKQQITPVFCVQQKVQPRRGRKCCICAHKTNALQMQGIDFFPTVKQVHDIDFAIAFNSAVAPRRRPTTNRWNSRVVGSALLTIPKEFKMLTQASGVGVLRNLDPTITTGSWQNIIWWIRTAPRNRPSPRPVYKFLYEKQHEAAHGRAMCHPSGFKRKF